MASKPRTGKFINCLHCTKEFYIPKNRFETAKYCSRRCGALAVRVFAKRECQICKKEFEVIESRSNKAKYCSRKCYYESQKGKGKVNYTCHHCGKEFIGHRAHKRKYCSRECNNKTSLKYFNPSYTTVRQAMKRRGMLKACERCGYNKVPQCLGVHHKDRNRNNNKLANLEVLCPNCHSEEHSKHICHSGIQA